MKNFYTLFLSLLFSGLMFGQGSYYILPAIDAGQNPGDLHSETEEPSGFNPGWTVITSSTSTDAWSAAQTIPFSFNFDGNAVTSYYVSNTGVLTFNSNPGTAPDDNNGSLPSLDIPDNSVMVWGINISGGNDAIISKTFGTAPNRQHWVHFASASHSTTGGGWTYWSIVLEESSDNIYIVDQRTGNGSGPATVSGITVGLQISSINYAEVPSVSSRATENTSSDNTYYEFIFGTANDDDMAGISLDMPTVMETNTSVFVSGLFRNVGLNTISSADFNYRINGGSVVTAGATGNLPASTGDFKTVSSPNQWTPSADGRYEIEMWLSGLNGGSDDDISNDTISASIAVTSNPPERRVVIEERTGTWCPWCPRGTVAMQHMKLNYHDETVLLAVHNQDPMAVSEYDSKLSGGFPTFTGDRVFTEQGISGNPQAAGSMIGFMTQRRKLTPIANVDITNMNYNAASGAVTVDVSSDFLIEANNQDLRYVLIFTEDGVMGTAGYAQANNYQGGGAGPLVDANGLDYTTAGNPVPANLMVYDHVLRGVEPQFEGATGSVPANITFQQNVTYSFSTTLPSSITNANHAYVNVLLLDYNKGGEVVNANMKKLTNVVDLDENDLLEASVYPNPARDFFTVALAENADFELELVNAMGQVVAKQSYTDRNSASISTGNLASGMYILNITSGDKYSSMNIAVTH